MGLRPGASVIRAKGAAKCRKVKHYTKAQAEDAAAVMQRRWRQQMWAEWCRECNAWHVTSASVVSEKNRRHSAAVREYWRRKLATAPSGASNEGRQQEEPEPGTA